MKKEILGYTTSGKAVFNSKVCTGFDLQDLKDAADLLSHLAHDEFKAMRSFQKPDPKTGFSLVPTDIAKFEEYSEAHTRLDELHVYFFRKFKAMQEGKAVYVEPSFTRKC
jgi:hypothetical protein